MKLSQKNFLGTPGNTELSTQLPIAPENGPSKIRLILGSKISEICVRKVDFLGWISQNFDGL